MVYRLGGQNFVTLSKVFPLKRVTFEKLGGCSGRLESTLELTITTADPAKLKKALTVTNKGVKWKLKHAKQSQDFLQEKLDKWDLIGGATISDSEAYLDARARLDTITASIAGLEASVKEQFYSENPDGSFSVPAGFWWLCDEIRDNAHLNKEIKPYYLPGLRNYQIEALAELYRHKRATLELATGLGKSKIIASIALAAVAADKRVMIIVPTEYLVGQMYKQLKELHPNATAIGGDFKHAKAGWDIMVITVDSSMKFIDQPDVIILDEAHHAPAATWQEMLCAAEQATHVYNLTATAFRTDGMDLAIHAYGGPIVYARGVKWGIDNDWLSKLIVFQVWIEPTENGSPLKLSEFVHAPRAYKRLMGAREPMALALSKLEVGLSKGRRAMVVFRTVKAAQVFKKHCAGIVDFVVAHADKKVSKFPKLPLKHFNDGTTNVLVACDKLVSEGIDIPSANLLILLTQNSSDITTLQMVGRILRKYEGKKDAVLIDIVTKGYDQYERAGNKRLALYNTITPFVTTIGKDENVY